MKETDFQFLFGYEKANELPFLNMANSLTVIQSLLASEKQSVINYLNDSRHSVREIIKDRTRFDPYEFNKSVKQFTKINIKVTDHIPKSIERLLSSYHPYIIKLLLKRQTILNNVDILKGLSEKSNIDIISTSLEMGFKSSTSEFSSIAKDYEELSKKLNDFAKELLKLFKDRDADIFGSYNVRTHDINLFWVSIALYAYVKNLPIDRITFIILAHEMAHLYTHIGLDINHNCWDDFKFVYTDKRITEGLAEFHSFEACRKSTSSPELIFAYANLLMDAPGIYQAWILKWYNNDAIKNFLTIKESNSIADFVKVLSDLPDIGEKVRLSTMIARTENETSFDDFLTDIKRTKKN